VVLVLFCIGQGDALRKKRHRYRGPAHKPIYVLLSSPIQGRCDGDTISHMYVTDRGYYFRRAHPDHEEVNSLHFCLPANFTTHVKQGTVSGFYLMLAFPRVTLM